MSNTLRSTFMVKSPMPLLPLSTACFVVTLFKQIISAHIHINHTNIDSKCMPVFSVWSFTYTVSVLQYTIFRATLYLYEVIILSHN